MKGTILGIDLGTTNVKICAAPNKQIYCEKNVIALENEVKLYSFGDDAYDMYEKVPDNITVTFPIKDGVIADYKNMREIMVNLLTKYFSNKLKGANILIAVPTDITEVEKRAYFDLVSSSKIKFGSIMVCEKPIAAAIGLDLPINTATGMFVVDLGADTTEVSVLSLGGIVLSQLIKVGGNKMCENIIAAVKKEHSLLIGVKTAGKLLSEIGYATDIEEASMKVVGRNMITGFPTTIEISSELVYDAIKDNLVSICESLKFILERTPPELTSDIIENGIYLTGGVSQIKNIDVLFSRETELEVKLSNTPIENVAIGLEKIASDRELNSLAYTMGGKASKH